MDRWILKMQGQIWTNYISHIKHRTKTLAWFYKGDRPINPLFESGENMFDLIESKIPDKEINELTQSEVEAETFIERLTSVNDLVMDPMLGFGTSGAAALKLNRRFIGIEIGGKDGRGKGQYFKEFLLIFFQENWI
jgi:DNA modification methylase